MPIRETSVSCLRGAHPASQRRRISGRRRLARFFGYLPTLGVICGAGCNPAHDIEEPPASITVGFMPSRPTDAMVVVTGENFVCRFPRTALVDLGTNEMMRIAEEQAAVGRGVFSPSLARLRPAGAAHPVHLDKALIIGELPEQDAMGLKLLIGRVGFDRWLVEGIRLSSTNGLVHATVWVDQYLLECEKSHDGHWSAISISRVTY